MLNRPVACPRCSGQNIRPSTKGGGLRLIAGLVGLRAIRCHHCLHLFWRFRSPAKGGRSRPRRADERPSGAGMPTPPPGEQSSAPPPADQPGAAPN
jgi:DNA-directed RNA polymerase subunit RPC12/RpoP